MEIREFKIDDFNRTASLFVELDSFHLLHRKELKPEIAKPQYRKEHLSKQLNNPHVISLIAEDNGAVAGFVTGEIKTISNHLVFRDCIYGQIDNLVVASRFRKMGVGKALMAEIEIRLRASKAEYIELRVYDFNKNAIKLYEDLGFKPRLIVMEK